MRLNQLACGASAAVIALAASSAVFAQETTGGIRGQVTDEAGMGVAGATVTVTHVPSGTRSTTMTDASGIYTTRSLRVGGPYTVDVTAPGAEPASAQVAAIGIGDPANVDVVVFSGATTVDELVITAAGAELATSPRSTFGLGDIETLPSISRDIKDFVRTSPFATTDPTNNDALSIGGQNTRFNAFLVDGIRQGDDFGLNGNGYPTQRSPISISALEAVSVDVAPFDVQYGTFTGGVVNSVTKSGGNVFSGEAFYETTNDGLQGNEFTYTDFVTGNEITRDTSGSTFEETTWGATLSGPILRDRLFFLINYEFYESTQPVLTGVEGSGAVNEVPGITQADVDLVRQISQDVYGFDPLDWSADALLVEDEKWFGKLDWNISDQHRAVLSYQQTEGGDLRLGSSSAFGNFPTVALLSQAYTLQSNLYTYKGQLFSDWTDRFSTEMSFSIKEVENISSPLAGNDFAAFQIFLDDPGGPGPIRSIRMGPERSRHANELTVDTTQFRVVGNYDAGNGHNLMAGFEREDIDVFNLFVQFANGEYEFASITDFENQQASYIGLQNTVTGDKNDGAAAFGYAVNSLFFQDTWDVSPTLTINAGLRYDWYTTDDAPQANPLFESTYGFASNSNIDGVSVLQPRVGFNWQATDTLTVYGGIGRFQGGSPNVWISNNFTNTGNLIGFFDCRIDATYEGQFSGSGDPVCPAGLLSGIDGFNPPQEALDRVADSANLGTGNLNIIDPTFNAPSIWKTSLGLVQELDLSRWGLGDGWTVSAEYVHSELENAIGWEDLNANLRENGTAPDGRPTFFGTGQPRRQVLMLTNFQGGETDQFAISLSKDWYEGWAEGLGFNLSYTHLDTTDQHAGTSSVAASNYQNLAVFNPNNPEVSTSNYEIEDAIKLNVRYERAFFGDYRTRLNVFAQHRSGLPFSYTFASNPGGMFGENYSANRQLLYVPQTDGSGVVTAGSDPIVTYGAGFDLGAFNEFLQNTGLIEYAGQIAPRNGFQSEDVTTVDLHIAQELPAFFPGGARLELYADVENFGNLLNDEWGVIQQVGFPYLSNNVVAANCQVQTCAAGPGNFYEYQQLRTNSAAVFNNQSVWQVKFGVRYRF
ncbi:MAG: outer membrane receptor protein involved in Fe transport [Brevundimonas sp.]|jgi:outer membrane receptor protein involved in Fe transport|uniref:TonB-dependent receptor n=1 Tax=Brevundimonas sp. TaxID=1871086 RepID=UPI0039E50ADE